MSSARISDIGRLRSIFTASPSPALRYSSGMSSPGLVSSFSIHRPSLLIFASHCGRPSSLRQGQRGTKHRDGADESRECRERSIYRRTGAPKPILSASFLEDSFEFYIAESMTGFIAVGRQVVVVLHRSLLQSPEGSSGTLCHRLRIDVIRRGQAAVPRLFYFQQGRDEFFGIEQSFGFLIEVCIVDEPPPFGYKNRK